jgi:HK97 family phage prohead protease
MQYDHEGRVFARTSNNTLAVAADEVGLAIEAELSGTEIGRQLYEEIEGGYTTKMSMGFRVAEDKREVIEDRDNGTVTVIRTITKISKLYDVSAVSLPANDATSISARSFGEGVIAETVKEIDARKARDRQKQKVRILLSLED